MNATHIDMATPPVITREMGHQTGGNRWLFMMTDGLCGLSGRIYCWPVAAPRVDKQRWPI